MKKLVIDKEGVKQNIDIVKSLTTSKIIGVLKGNGYGLGIVELASALSSEGVDFFAVSEIWEAETLRLNGFSEDILLLTPAYSQEAVDYILKYNLIATASSLDSIKLLSDTALEKGIKVCAHLKLDTGFGRYGFLESQIDGLAGKLNNLKGISFTGTYTHFSHSFSEKSKACDRQYSIFYNMVQTLNKQGFSVGLLHVCNSCAFLKYPLYHLDAVRIGSAFLGRVPIKEKKGLKKIGFFETEINEVKLLPKGWKIGYGNTFRLKRPTKIGIIQAGYRDGLFVEKMKDTFRLFDIIRFIWNDLKLIRKNFNISINGKSFPIIGRINMFSVVIDLSDGITQEIPTKIKIDVNPVMVSSEIKREWL
jgi:alanine racemase